MNIVDGIRTFAMASPSLHAVVDEGRALTYAGLDDRSSRVANALLAAGLQPGNRVAIVMGNRLEYCEVAAGAAKAGMPIVPINPRLTPAEVSYILEHSEARALIIDNALSALAADSAPEVVWSIDGTDIGTAYEPVLASASPNDPGVVVDETDPFCVAYTSGTTGKPKGVEISHRSRCLTFIATALEWGLGPGRRTIAVAPLYHGAGFAFAWAALHTGGTVAMLRSFDPERLMAMTAGFRPHSVFLVPTHAQMIRAAGLPNNTDTSSLETLYFNAAALPQELKLWVLDAFPNTGVHELYGSTEAGIISNLRPVDIRRKVACVGPPWYMTEIRVVDTAGNEVPRGGTGELYTRSPYLMNGYLKDPEATAACTTDDGFLTCGDIVHVDEEGYLYVVDRVKDMIISGGTNVYPREIEEVLHTHPSVADVAVIGVPDEQWGERVAAVVVAAPGTQPDPAALESHCRSSLAGYKIPREWKTVDVLPRNAAGKVLKRELRDTYSEV